MTERAENSKATKCLQNRRWVYCVDLNEGIVYTRQDAAIASNEDVLWLQLRQLVLTLYADDMWVMSDIFL